MGSGYLYASGFHSTPLNLMHKHKNKVQNNRGYAPGLAWVRYNQKLAFHRDDMIIKAPPFRYSS
jgi:hypothetical protein